MTTLPLPQITRYQQWLEREQGLVFADY